MPWYVKRGLEHLRCRAAWQPDETVLYKCYATCNAHIIGTYWYVVVIILSLSSICKMLPFHWESSSLLSCDGKEPWIHDLLEETAVSWIIATRQINPNFINVINQCFLYFLISMIPLKSENTIKATFNVSRNLEKKKN